MVNRWTLSDGVNTMTFRFNPYTMSSPYASKQISVDTIQQITIMNPAPGAEWGFTGYLYSDEEYNKFIYWYNKDMILELTDHLLRTWRIVSRELNLTDRRPSATNPNRYEYTWKVVNLGQVEESS